MVNVKKGVLITCDPAMRQLLIHLDETRALGSKFVVKELDDTHIFVDREILPHLEQKIDALMDSLSPDQTDR
uniref:General transcription and DNA repair factor IIH subunit TFB5 n=1 Tax=Acrobeloides nanus TaxID=290746 RepID=A0A914CD76_9BILA